MSTANSPPKIACPHCQALIKAPALPAGSQVNCPKCGQAFRLGGETRGQESGDRSQVAGQVQRPKSKVNANPAARTQYSVLSTSPAAKQPAVEGDGPANFSSAAATTQPAHRPPGKEPPPVEQPPRGGWQAPTESLFPAVGPPRRSATQDHLVDPNLLPPPSPKEKPKPTTVTVTCYLCGTRTEAALDLIGKTITCPDCHAVNEVVAPKRQPQQQPKGPTLDDAPEFGMSQPAPQPAYRPLQAPRGEYEVLSALDPASVEHGWNLPDQRGAAHAADDDEVRLEAPVERVELKRELPVLPEPDPQESLYDGKYNDDLIGEKVDRRQPEAWKRAPFLIGLVEFLFYPGTISRWVLYSIGLAIPLNVGNSLYLYATGDDPSGKVAAIFLAMICSVSLGLWAAPFFASALAVVQDTANGQDHVEGWPDWNFTDWFYPALFIPWAAFLSGLPGMFLTSFLLGSGLDPRIMPVAMTLPVPLSWLVLFPPVLFSMLAEASLMAPFSAYVLRTYRSASEAWFLFYVYSLGLLLVAFAAGTLSWNTNVVLCSLGAAAFVMAALLYARLLGRLMWYAGQKEPQFDQPHDMHAADT